MNLQVAALRLLAEDGQIAAQVDWNQVDMK